MKVLIVGGAGYIGSHVAKHLALQGMEPVVLDDLSRGSRAALKWGPFYEGSCGSRPLLDRVFSENAIEAVMHFAAFAYVGESVERPDLYYGNNVAAALTLLDAMVAHGVRHFVFSSSCATFGEALSLPIDETHPQHPINPYGRTKLMVERILADYDRAFGLRSCVFRYFNAAGCDPEGEIGENHDPETHLIPLVLESLGGRGPAISIFGTDYPTPDGTCLRDYVHVNDLAEAHRLGLQKLLETGHSEDYNLGNGNGFSVREVVAAAERVTGLRASVIEKPRRPGDPPALVGSSAKARAILGWKPHYTDLEEIIRTAWLWERSR
ncbi:MAG: UDP-glucose 4-epimerase GalE, partial [Rectinemataceae bacterium]